MTLTAKQRFLMDADRQLVAQQLERRPDNPSNELWNAVYAHVEALESEVDMLKKMLRNITYTHHDGYADKDADDCPACSMVPPGYQGGISR